MHKSLFLFVSLSLGVALAASESATLTGVVLDPDARAVAGARVECAGRVVRTGADGRFEINGVDFCRATVSAAGFEPRLAELGAGKEASIRLSLAGLSETVVVTATRSPARVEETGVSATVLTENSFGAGRPYLVSEQLRLVPGLQVATTGRIGAQTSIFTRGASRTATLVLIDGVPMNDPGGEFNYGNLSGDDIERAEIIRGPASALFGAEAAAGVVQLFTRRGRAEQVRPHGSISLERGNFATGAWRAGLTGGSGSRLDYSLQAGKFSTAGEFPNDGFRNATGSANLGWRLSDSTQLRGLVRVSDSVLGVPGQVAFGLYDLDARETNRQSLVSLRLENARGGHYWQSFSFGYGHVRDLFTDSQMDGPYQLAALVRDNGASLPRTYLVSLLNPDRLPSVLPSGTRLVLQAVTLYPSEPYLNSNSRTRGGYQGNWASGTSLLAFGYEFERQQGLVSATEVSRTNHGSFLHAQRALAGHIFLSGGLRVERSSAYGRKLAPRGAVSVRLAENRGPLSSAMLRFSAGRGITEPSLVQNFSRELFFSGNPNLVPEKTTSYEAGLVQNWFARRLETEVALFHNSFRDLITFVSLPPPVWGSWRNLDESRARGLEFSARARFSGALAASASWTRLWTRVVRSNSPSSIFYGVGQELARRPGNSGSVSISYAPARWWLQAGAVLVGERQDADYWLGVNRNPGYQNVFTAGGWRLAKNFQPYFRIENLLNSRYQEALGYSNMARSLRGGLLIEW